MPIESVMPSSHLILCCPLLLLPSIPPSFRVFANESTLRMRWPKYWSFSFSVSLSSEYPGLIFRMDRLPRSNLMYLNSSVKNISISQNIWLNLVLSHSVMFNCLRPYGLYPTRFLGPWGFSRQEYWSGLPCPSPGDLPNPGIEPKYRVLQVDSLPSESPGKPDFTLEQYYLKSFQRN